MHKIILNLFGFFKSCIQFIKIIILFSILMLLLYWIQNLTGNFWAWASFMNPFLDFFLDCGKSIMPGSIMLFAAVFEFKYFAAILIFLIIYALSHFGYIAVTYVEDLYDDGRRLVKRIEENCLNKTLESQHTMEQKKIHRFRVYVETQLKSNYSNRDYNIDMEEQNRILLKHLIEKLFISPEKYGNGFMFTFESFSKIDNILDILIRLRESRAPIDYIICVQISGRNPSREQGQMQTLINLKLLNKVATLTDTVYRYSFNDEKGYDTMQIGLFQGGDGPFEVYEFVKKY